MIRRAVWTGLVGLVGLVGLGGAIVASEAPHSSNRVLVWFAAHDLHPGVSIQPGDLYGLWVPPELVPSGAFFDPELLLDRIPHERILGNEIVRAQRLADPEIGATLHALVPRGTRGIVLPAEVFPKDVRTGDYVDIWTGTSDPDSVPVLPAVFVASAGEEAGGRAGIALVTTANQAEVIAHAEHVVGLRISSRRDANCGFLVPSDCRPRGGPRSWRQLGAVPLCPERDRPWGAEFEAR